MLVLNLLIANIYIYCFDFFLQFNQLEFDLT